MFSGVLIIMESLILIFLEDYISSGVWWSIVLLSIVGLFILILVYSTWLQPQNQDPVSFKVSCLQTIFFSFTNLADWYLEINCSDLHFQ